MKIGIGLPNQVRNVRPTVISEWARRSEEPGFSTLGSVGRIAYPGVMDTIALAAAAGATSRIGLISNVLLGPVWPPVLLAKEAASIDAVSEGRFMLGIGLGGRPDDFVVDGLGPRGTGKRLDRDLEVYKSLWRGEIPPGCDNPVVPEGTREVPLLFWRSGRRPCDRPGVRGHRRRRACVQPDERRHRRGGQAGRRSAVTADRRGAPTPVPRPRHTPDTTATLRTRWRVSDDSDTGRNIHA
ncbi:LLM class flavin-dependent oxidoreductase [Streptomyces sp. NPDC093984]|uniref:LLM class flavin-dependent oxidoreductase n=1 Tax=Streptomyces sp. NPDC093984 TaxID=3366052 RepID=UPI00380D8D1C